jgi:hypothetical protein
MIIILVAGIEPILIYRQWLGFERLFPSMIRRRLVKPTPGSESLLLEEVRRANRFFGRVGRSSGVLALIAVLAAMVIVLAEQQGVYGVFGGEGPHQNNYGDWWASFSTYPLAWAAYSLIVGAGLYAAVVMNVVAARPVLILWRTRSALRATASPDNEDGYFGWKQAREILSAGYIATALYGIAISCLLLTVSGGAWWAAALLILQWLAVLPAHLYVPLSFTVKAIRDYKEEAISRLTEELAVLEGNDGLAAEQGRELIAQRLERVRQIRALPFRSAKDIFAALFLFVASLCSIYAVIGTWYALV